MTGREGATVAERTLLLKDISRGRFACLDLPHALLPDVIPAEWSTVWSESAHDSTGTLAEEFIAREGYAYSWNAFVASSRTGTIPQMYGARRFVDIYAQKYRHILSECGEYPTDDQLYVFFFRLASITLETIESWRGYGLDNAYRLLIRDVQNGDIRHMLDHDVDPELYNALTP